MSGTKLISKTSRLHDRTSLEVIRTSLEGLQTSLDVIRQVSVKPRSETRVREGRGNIKHV